MVYQVCSTVSHVRSSRAAPFPSAWCVPAAYQDALALAVSREVMKEVRKELAPKPPPLVVAQEGELGVLASELEMYSGLEVRRELILYCSVLLYCWRRSLRCMQGWT